MFNPVRCCFHIRKIKGQRVYMKGKLSNIKIKEYL